MVPSQRRAVLLCLLGFACRARNAESLTALDVCADFALGGSEEVSWHLDDCVQVWTTWSLSLDTLHHTSYADRQVMRDTAEEMRRRGTPCVVHTSPTYDGVGSSAIRHIAAWLYAEDVGCDWVHPDFNQDNEDLIHQGNKSSLYCHILHRPADFNPMTPITNVTAPRRCASVSWMLYFNFGKVSVPPISSEGKALKQIRVLPSGGASTLATLVDEIKRVGWDNLPWTRLRLVLSPQEAAHYAVKLDSWDALKRETTRNALQQMRHNFHEFPRPGHNSPPECPYDMSRLNFAIHIRLGDRKGVDQATVKYLELLETFMDTVSAAVVEQGYSAPLFHIFSETVAPCPWPSTNAFSEFPNWPVEPDQILPCRRVKAPEDCPEKQAGGPKCFPERSGVFRVEGKPIVLNVGADVVNALSCMIRADGILMGCSAFGELAGLFSNGIKFFSVSCGGKLTWEQNELFPALAVAERGDMWVPVKGSWRDPVLQSTEILQRVLRKHVQNKFFGVAGQ